MAASCSWARWPHLTGARTLYLPDRAQGRVDAADRDELVERCGPGLSKKVRACSKGFPGRWS
ncbi:hypothetical protein MXD63_16070 [Frankia sp. Cpl3]|nr:hypothetical protein [Frankia sp. Cpl3]